MEDPYGRKGRFFRPFCTFITVFRPFWLSTLKISPTTSTCLAKRATTITTTTTSTKTYIICDQQLFLLLSFIIETVIWVSFFTSNEFGISLSQKKKKMKEIKEEEAYWCDTTHTLKRENDVIWKRGSQPFFTPNLFILLTYPQTNIG